MQATTAGERELRRLKRTKQRCCPDNDGCNRCLRRGARYLLAHGPAPAASATSFAAQLPDHLRARCESDWASRHGNDIDFPFAREGLAAALRRDVPAALRLQQVGRCVLQVALEAGALGVALKGADDVQEVVVHMLARLIRDDASQGRGGSTCAAEQRSARRAARARASGGSDDDGDDDDDDDEGLALPLLDVRGAIEEVQALLARRCKKAAQDAAGAADELHFEMVRRLAAQIARGGLGEQEWEQLEASREGGAGGKSYYCSSFIDPSWIDDADGGAARGCWLPLSLLFRRRPSHTQVTRPATPLGRGSDGVKKPPTYSPGKQSPATRKFSPEARVRRGSPLFAPARKSALLPYGAPSPLKLKLGPACEEY